MCFRVFMYVNYTVFTNSKFLMIQHYMPLIPTLRTTNKIAKFQIFPTLLASKARALVLQFVALETTIKKISGICLIFAFMRNKKDNNVSLIQLPPASRFNPIAQHFKPNAISRSTVHSDSSVRT